MNPLHAKIGQLAAEAIKLAVESGLSWDESICALGLASKALAIEAAKCGGGSEPDCVSHAVKRFGEGMRQDVSVLGIAFN